MHTFVVVDDAPFIRRNSKDFAKHVGANKRRIKKRLGVLSCPSQNLTRSAISRSLLFLTQRKIGLLDFFATLKKQISKAQEKKSGQLSPP